jgi:hypothetical protein
MEQDNSKEVKPSRRQARKADGKYSEVPPKEVEHTLPKDVKYTVKPKVDGTTGTAGKYGKRKPIRPTFGNVHTITH